MPVNPEYVGKSYPPTAPYSVGAAKIREFAEAVGAKDPVHVDTAAAVAAWLSGRHRPADVRRADRPAVRGAVRA